MAERQLVAAVLVEQVGLVEDEQARLVAGADLLERNPDPTETEVREALAGNLCRCTGYHNIVKSVLDAASQTGAQV